MRACNNCQHWRKLDNMTVCTPELLALELGACRRYAPRPSPVPLHEKDQRITAEWPLTAHVSNCGEWSPDAATVKARREKRASKIRERHAKRLRS